MSDESDETRSFSPFDETNADGRPVKKPEPALDETRPAGEAVTDDATRVTPRADQTSVMPPATDDWAAGRGKPVWSGRAEVRPPQPGSASYDTDWQTGSTPVVREPRERWWMPIVVGIVVLILLGLLAWGIYLIVQNSGDDAPSTTPSTTVATTATPSAATSTPSSQPTTTAPSAEPSTTEPTKSEVLVPALRGLSLDDARDALNQTGLRYRVLYRASTAAPEGTVIDSDPKEGQEVPPDTRVTIVVSGTDPSSKPSSAAASASAGTGGN
jgi:cytoskeletal protein RodZ